MTRSFCRRLSPLILAGFGGLAPAPSAIAQSVHGYVLERGTGQPIHGALVSLVSGDSVLTAELSDSSGLFVLEAAFRPGTFVRTGRFGYRTYDTPVFDGPAFPEHDVTVFLIPAAVTLDSIIVRAGPRREVLHAATYDGLYARRAVTPPVGSAKVLVRGDARFDAATDVRQVMRALSARGACTPFVFWNGTYRGARDATAYLQTPIHYLEGVEFYATLDAVPLDFRQAWQPSEVRRCGVLAIWTRDLSRSR